MVPIAKIEFSNTNRKKYMITFIITCVLFVVAIVAIASLFFKSTVAGLATAVIATIVGLILMATSIVTIVPTRQVGIPITFGVTGAPMPNGFNFKAPWTDVELMDMTVQSLDSSEDNPTLAKDVDNMDVFVHNNLRWSLNEDATDEIFNDTKSIEGDNMQVISDTFVQPALRAVVSDVMASYNPLAVDKPGNTEIANQIKAGLEKRIGNRFNISAVEVTFIDVTQATKDRINMLNAERANTRIAEQRAKTATAEAESNRVLSESIKNDPNVLVSKCLDAINEGKSLPAGFQCWPGTSGSVVVPAK